MAASQRSLYLKRTSRKTNPLLDNSQEPGDAAGVAELITHRFQASPSMM